MEANDPNQQEAWYLTVGDLPGELSNALGAAKVGQEDHQHRMIFQYLLTSLHLNMLHKQLILDSLSTASRNRATELVDFLLREAEETVPAVAASDPARLLQMSAEQTLAAFALAAYHDVYPDIQQEQEAIEKMVTAKARRSPALVEVLDQHADWSSPTIKTVYGLLRPTTQKMSLVAGPNNRLSRFRF